MEGPAASRRSLSVTLVESLLRSLLLVSSVACDRPVQPTPVASSSSPTPSSSASAGPQAVSSGDAGQTSDDAELQRAQRDVAAALVSCSYNPNTTPYGLEYEWFRVTMTYAPSGEVIDANVVRVNGTVAPRVGPCVIAKLALSPQQGRIAPLTPAIPRVVTYPLGGRWNGH
jgi:hypothetical protein